MNKEEGKQSYCKSMKITDTKDSTKGMCLGITTEKIKGVAKWTMHFWCMGQPATVVECHTPLPIEENVHRPFDPHSLTA